MFLTDVCNYTCTFSVGFSSAKISFVGIVGLHFPDPLRTSSPKESEGLDLGIVKSSVLRRRCARRALNFLSCFLMHCVFLSAYLSALNFIGDGGLISGTHLEHRRRRDQRPPIYDSVLPLVELVFN